jgi:hypothetical protein
MGKYWAYVKRNPTIFIGAVIVFGLLLFLLTRGGGSSTGSTSVIASGPSEAFQAQALAISAQQQQAQLAANVQLQGQALELEALTRQIEGQENLAILSMQMGLAELEANRAISSEQTAASLAALTQQLNYGLATTEANIQGSVDMATIAAESATTQMMINASIQREMLAAQTDMFNTQVRAQQDANILSTIQTAKKKDRDTLIGAFIANRSGQAFTGGKGDDRIVIGAPVGVQSNIGYVPNFNAGYVPNNSTVM